MSSQIIQFSFLFLANTIKALQFLIFIVIIMSWFRPKDNFFTIWAKKIVYPMLIIARKITPRTGMIDFSPLVAIIILDLFTLLLNLLYQQLTQ